MEDEIRRLNDLKTLMELQAEGMDDFQETQTRVRQALTDRSWNDLEKALRALEFKAEGLRCLEERRDAAWQRLCINLSVDPLPAYRVFPHLSSPWRETISGLHRTLKVKALQLKGFTQGLNAYLQTASGMIRAVVDHADPGQKGRLYSKNGSLKTSGVRALVLDRHL